VLKVFFITKDKHGGTTMSTALTAFLISLGAVTLAEMGDKTQLLAMAFATRYKPAKVLVGVFIATVLNHALAVAAGSLLARYNVLGPWIQLAASVSFILFGLWTIRGDSLEGEDKRKSRFGPVATVTIAFFIAELGDKTQLTTIALAAKYPVSPIFILMGTTTGMLLADGLGILIGVVLCRKIPERTIKLASAAVFGLFGLFGFWQAVSPRLGVPGTLAATAALALASGLAAWLLLHKERTRGKTVGE
jgi:Ca2+/H+ antiporter, TMEM165/GDT1 family